MTQRRDDTPIRFKPFYQRSLLIQGMGWLGGISILSSGLVLAQAPDLVEAGAVPSAQDLLMADPVAPAAPVAPIPIAPEPPPAPIMSAEPVEPAPAVSAPSEAPAVVLELHTPPEATATRSPAPIDLGNGYIDTTDYNVGATSPERPNIVLSERSTGCQAVLQQGQAVPNSVCATAPSVARQPSGQSSGQSGNPGNGSTVNIGPISVSASGFGVGQTTPSGRNYYNPAARPSGLLGNGNVSLMFPLSMPAAITSAFGWRIHPISGDRRFHAGTDLGAPMGTPVLAAYAGRVSVSDFLGGYGLTVVLNHGETEQTLYAHLSELFVQAGEWIEQGEVIGRLGSTGNSTGPHLHFEVRQRTPDGWIAMDAGEAIQYALAQFMRGGQIAQATPPVPADSVEVGMGGPSELILQPSDFGRRAERARDAQTAALLSQQTDS